jgi:hypothetical protein
MRKHIEIDVFILMNFFRFLLKNSNENELEETLHHGNELEENYKTETKFWRSESMQEKI